ncbi:hypothetical protein F2Q70_00026880 [Brassica cretica]|uniref:40S ribosomal protein S21 n=1 Tax=Brassica cretica TaxID=69181 RepID=A0A8S9LFV7_BRACR|nr:hypothetical protein F2Q70_00026880 [Brassica cretica]
MASFNSFPIPKQIVRSSSSSASRPRILVRSSMASTNSMLVFVPPHPLIKHWLSLLRCDQTPPLPFFDRFFQAIIMQNEEGVVTELYIPRKCSATNRLITSKDHASVQLNIGHLDADGIYTGQFTTLALCGFVRAQGDADSGVDRLWQKKKVETKQL